MEASPGGSLKLAPAKTPSLELLPLQSEERRGSRIQSTNRSIPPDNPIGSKWPSLLIRFTNETSSPIPPGQKPVNRSSLPDSVSWKIQLKNPEDDKRDRVGNCAQYIKGNEILPITEITKTIEPWILSLVGTDLKTRRVTGLKKEAFEELRTVDIPCQYFCRCSFTTWDVLLPTEVQASRTAATNITINFFRLQPEYMRTRRIRITDSNIQAYITGEVLASFLRAKGRVEEVSLLRSATGTTFEDYVFRICLTREGFQATPETRVSRDMQMMVIVEGRRPAGIANSLATL